MMAAGIIYALPPIVLLLALRRHVVASLAMVSAGV
jgi:ABC-type glycerol-3-phosphate transport system permease component